jgi:hypothetical protein
VESPRSVLKSLDPSSDEIAKPNATHLKKPKIDEPFTKLQKPTPSTASQNFQVIGVNPSKTVFSKAEFVKLQKTLCPEGQPLVLVQDKSTKGSVEEFILGAELMNRLEDEEITEDELRDCSAYLFHGGDSTRPMAIPLSSLMGQSDDLSLVDALLNVNDPYQDTIEVHARQYLIAAMINANILGLKDTELASETVRRIPEKFRKPALNVALFSCADQKKPTLAQQLLEWGANPNAQQVDDELSVLGVAIRHFNEPMIRVLLDYSADPLTETGTDISAVELVKTEPYKNLAPLFAKFAAAL